MKIFNENKDWSEKVNFVDDNNVLVGFDMSSQCCESFGWFLSSKEPTTELGNENDENIETEGYLFDASYFEERDPEDKWDSGGSVIFRLTKGDSEIFLTLYNSHNGYYSHGFDMVVGGEIIQSSCI